MIQFSRANGGTGEITLTEIKSTFFDVHPGGGLKEPQAQQQNALLVNLNSIVVAMQTYVLEAMKQGMESGVLDLPTR